MPLMDGVEATKQIRSVLRKSTPIVALTANAFKHDIDLYLSVGMNDYLIKPYKEEDLYSKIDLHLRSDKSIIKNDDVFDSIAETEIRSEIIEPLKNETSQKLYNLDQLNEIGRGDEQFVKIMLEMFSKLANQTIEQMLDAYTIADIASIKKLAHKIKPSIDNLGIVSIFDKIRALEAYDITKYNNEDLKQLLDEIIGVLKDVIDDIS